MGRGTTRRQKQRSDDDSAEYQNDEKPEIKNKKIKKGDKIDRNDRHKGERLQFKGLIDQNGESLEIQNNSKMHENEALRNQKQREHINIYNLYCKKDDQRMNRSETQIVPRNEEKRIVSTVAKKPQEQMTIVEIINDSKRGLIAPSEDERRKRRAKEKQAAKDQKLKNLDKKGSLKLQEETVPEPQLLLSNTLGIAKNQQSDVSQGAQAKKSRVQIVVEDGKQIIKQPEIKKGPQDADQNTRQIVEINYQQRKLSSLAYLRPSKKQKAHKWTVPDEEKFYDAIKVFGENCDLIHSIIFCPNLAKPRYWNKDDFSERSIVQLRNKFKKDADTIDQHIAKKSKNEGVAWFEKKYGIQITNYNKKDKMAKNSDDSDSDYQSSSYHSERSIQHQKMRNEMSVLNRELSQDSDLDSVNPPASDSGAVRINQLNYQIQKSPDINKMFKAQSMKFDD